MGVCYGCDLNLKLSCGGLGCESIWTMGTGPEIYSCPALKKASELRRDRETRKSHATVVPSANQQIGFAPPTPFISHHSVALAVDPSHLTAGQGYPGPSQPPPFTPSSQTLHQVV